MNLNSMYALIKKLREAFLLAIVLVCSNALQAQETPQTKIGVILPLTGNAASYGSQFKSGIELAAKQHPELSFIYEDSQFDNAQALTAFKKLTATNKISALFSFGGATCEVLNQEAKKLQLLHLAAGCNTAKFQDSDSSNFRLDVNESIAALKMAQYLKSKNIKSVGLVFVNNSWATTIIEYTRQAFKAAQIQIPYEIKFEEATSLNIRSELLKLKAQKPQLIFMISLPDLTPSVLKQMQELQLQLPIMSNISIENPEVVRLAKQAAEGISYLSVKPQASSHAAFSEFYAAFPTGNPFAAWGFDSVKLAALALKTPSPKAYLQQLDQFIGAFNKYDFDRSGELHLEYEIREIKNGVGVFKAEIPAH